MTNPGMKCTRCRGPARHRFPSHNARFCDECLDVFFRGQVAKAIKKYRMAPPGGPMMIAVSGGKDSLAVWRALHDMGYETAGLHLDLGLGEFAAPSLAAARAMARRLGRPLHVYSFQELAGHAMEDVVRANRRNFCSVCGTMKRYWLNRLTLEHGFDTVATGHQLDDEAGRLLGNMLHFHDQYLANQWPVLEAAPGLARKIKPLCRLSEAEVRAYAKAHDLPVAQGKCPRSKGATLPYYQEAMQWLDDKMPGTMHNFYLEFLRRKQPPAPPLAGAARCASCGAPTFGQECTACRLLAKTEAWKQALWERGHATDA